MLTGYGSIATALEAVRRGADHYLSKPVDVDQILAAYEAVNSSRPGDSFPPTTVPSLARVEWEHIQRVLTDCGGNVSQAAKLLGLHRRSLQRKLSKVPPANLKWFWLQCWCPAKHRIFVLNFAQIHNLVTQQGRAFMDRRELLRTLEVHTAPPMHVIPFL